MKSNFDICLTTFRYSPGNERNPAVIGAVDLKCSHSDALNGEGNSNFRGLIYLQR